MILAQIKKSSEDINGYTISYSNEETYKLFKHIQTICSSKFTKSKIKPVFNKNAKDRETAYFKLKMIEKDITDFYSDKKCTKSINGLDLVSKYGSTPRRVELQLYA